MSRISKMSIQGIRSFGPEDRDVGVIQFFNPLTLILGPNGTGKTTIIECLKYITTGELPPGGKNGAAFINDPKIAKETEVKAQVCLQFIDVKGDPCIAKRSLVATQKKTKVEMKTLEGLITKRLSNGEKVNISSKCAEMDREMISLLGVSKPVLENVIFCHQEESNWPLSEGKALKQKFDDIFASTRYVKALEVIRKCRQDQVTTIREYQIELKYLKENKDKVDQVNSRLLDLEERRQASSDGIQKVEVKLEPIIEKLRILEEKEEDVRRISNAIAKLEGEKNQIKRATSDLQKNIKNQFQGTKLDLEEEIADFGNKVVEKEQDLQTNKERQSALDREIQRYSEQRSTLLTDIAKLEQDLERNEKFVKSRNDKIRVVVVSHEFRGTLDSTPSNLQVRTVVDFLKDKTDSLQAEARQKKAEFSSGTSRLQKDLDLKRSQKTKLETEQKIKNETFRKNNEEINRINEQLNLMDMSANKLEYIKFDINEMEAKLSEFRGSFDSEAMKTELQNLQKQKGDVESEIKSLDSELSRLNQDLAVRTQLDIFNKDKSSKEETVRRLMAKNGDTLRHLLGSLPTENIGKSLDKYIREQSRRVRNASEQLQQLKSSLTKLETRRKIEQESLVKKQEELRGYKQKISNVTQGKDFIEGLNALMTKLQTNQDNKGHLMAMEYMFKKYIEKLRRENPDCPLCHRPFDEQSEVEELVSEMEGKLNMIPDKLERLHGSIAETSSDYEKWLQLNPIKGMVEKCRDVEIPRIENSIQSLNAEISSLTLQINEKEEELEADSNDEGVAKSLVADATQVDRIQLEVNELNKKISTQSFKLKDSSARSVEDVQSEKSAQINQRETLDQQLQLKQQKYEECSARQHKMQNDLHDLKSELLKIESNLQSKMKFESSRQDLISTNEMLSREIENAKKSVDPIVTEIEDILSRKSLLEKQHEMETEELEAKVSRLNEDLRQLNSLQSEIDRYEREKGQEKLNICLDSLRSLESKGKDLEVKRSRFMALVDQLKQDIAAQKIQLRELEDNRQLMTKQEEMKNLERQVRQEQEQLGNCSSVEELVQQKATLKRDKGKLDSEVESFKGRRQQLDGEISALKRELTSNALMNAEEKYRDQMIKLRTTELASSDLEKYYKALDRTIMSYHNQKMADINKIIRELWRNTYKGQDIETIEIRSDEEEGSGAAKSRRTYHYRVVMMNGGAELDMRGRCSAGQKVLASLIIRLALAETFCLNCGVLALDEPTTNLDRENIESLAYALVDIIKSRSKQKNFQLIVITHDEDFVELLGRSDYVDEFFRVKKDESLGSSRLVKCKINNLQTK